MAIAPAAPSLQQAPDDISAADEQIINYDIDVILPDGRTAGRSASVSSENVVTELTALFR